MAVNIAVPGARSAGKGAVNADITAREGLGGVVLSVRASGRQTGIVTIHEAVVAVHVEAGFAGNGQAEQGVHRGLDLDLAANVGAGRSGGGIAAGIKPRSSAAKNGPQDDREQPAQGR